MLRKEFPEWSIEHQQLVRAKVNDVPESTSYSKSNSLHNPNPMIDRRSSPDLSSPWWYTSNDRPGTLEQEPEEVFLSRVHQLRDWILQREESCLAIVAHWGVLQALTNESFTNCELQAYTLDVTGPA